jgi:hypothetical protein
MSQSLRERQVLMHLCQEVGSYGRNGRRRPLVDGQHEGSGLRCLSCPSWRLGMLGHCAPNVLWPGATRIATGKAW